MQGQNLASFSAVISASNGTALPATAAVGIEIGTSMAGHAVLIDWRRLSNDGGALARLLHRLYRSAEPGALPLPLRILDLSKDDLWSAKATWGTRGAGGAQVATLDETAFTLDGISYRVDRLANVSGVSPREIELSTTPDPPDGTRLALASKATASKSIAGLVRYYPLMSAARPADAAVDRRWQRGSRIDVDEVDELGTGNAVYLTRSPGLARAGVAWSVEVTPVLSAAELLGYARAGEIDQGRTPGFGSIEPDSMIPLDGVDYTVNAIAFVTSGNRFAVHTSPALPSDAAGWFEVEQDFGPAFYGLTDSMAFTEPLVQGGRQWPQQKEPWLNVQGGWKTLSDGAGSPFIPRRVRLLRSLAPTSTALRLSLSTSEAGEGTSQAVTVTAMLDGSARQTATVVRVTVGVAGDTATSGTDYTAVAPFTLTIPAGDRSASGTFTLAVTDDADTERAETLTVTATRAGLIGDAATVTIPYNDYGTYLSGTLTPTDGVPGDQSSGFRNDSHDVEGTLSETRFGCCVSAGGDEVAYTIDLLTTSSSSTTENVPVLQLRYGDLASAPPDDALTLHIGDSSAPLSDAQIGSGGQSTNNVRKWPLADLGLEPFMHDEMVPVRLTGPKHPRILSVDAVSKPQSILGARTPVYGRGELLRLAVTYDEPVTVTGSPELAFQLNDTDIALTDYSATYMADESTPTQLVFGYEVAAMSSVSGSVVLLDDTDAMADGAQSPLTGGTIRSVEARSTRVASRFMPVGRTLGEDENGYLYGNPEFTPSSSEHDGKPTVSLHGPADGAEGGGTLVYTAFLSVASTTSTMIVDAAFSGTATYGMDYTTSLTAVTDTLRFPADTTVKRFTVTPTDDTDDEADETIIVTLSEPRDLVLDPDRSSVTTTLADNDLPTVSLAAPALAGTGMAPYLFEFEAHKSYATLHEDAKADLETNAAWTLTRTGMTDEELEVTVRVSESGEGDFVTPADEGTHTVTFEADETTATFKIVTDDNVNERHGTVTVTLLDGADYDVTGTASSTIAVRDDEAAVVATLNPLDRTIGEGGTARFDLVLTTRDDGAENGTFTEAADVGRALRRRSGFSSGMARDLRVQWSSEEREATITPTSGDFSNVARTRTVPLTGWAAADGVFSTRLVLDPLVARENDDGMLDTADNEETIEDERLTMLLQAASGEIRMSNSNGSVHLATRENIADLTDSSNDVVPLSGLENARQFLRAVVTIKEEAGIALALAPETLTEGAATNETTVTATAEPAPGRRRHGHGVGGVRRRRPLGVRRVEPDADHRRERDGEHGHGEAPRPGQRRRRGGPGGDGHRHAGRRLGPRGGRRGAHHRGRRPAGGSCHRAVGR